MSDNGRRKNILEKIIVDETRNAAGRLGHFNHLDSICFRKDLTPEEFVKVYEGVLRNTMKLCESRLKNGFSRKERYEKEMAKVQYALCTDESDPYSI